MNYLSFAIGCIVGTCFGMLVAAVLGSLHREPEPPVEDWGRLGPRPDVVLKGNVDRLDRETEG